MLLKGLNSATKIRNVRNAGAEGVLLLKRQKALEGFLKFAHDWPDALFLRVQPLGVVYYITA